MVKKAETTEIAVVNQSYEMQELTKEAIKKFFVPQNCSDEELTVALMYAQKNNLDPWKKEVYFVKFGEKPIQCITSYEVALKRAEDFPQFNGIEWETTGSPYGSQPDLEIIPDLGQIYTLSCGTRILKTIENTHIILPQIPDL